MSQIHSTAANLDSASVEEQRQLFPALQRTHQDSPLVYFDGPAGTQVPTSVISAISDYLTRCNSNLHGNFPTSQESDQWLHEVHCGAADFLGVSDPDEVIFGPNMTSLTFHLSRSLAKTWKPGDNVVVTRLDHDANVRPWVLAAEDAGVEVRMVPVDVADCTLDLEKLNKMLDSRTKLLAVGAASNSVGTINPVADIVERAHAVGALVYVDAVHYAPHRLVDCEQWNCDFLACSAYKFFGPHIGVLWGRRQLLESLVPYRLNPAPNVIPGRWMTGTQNHECLVGVLAAIDYLADLGRKLSGEHELLRRPALQRAFTAIENYERQLSTRLISGLIEMPQISVKGIVDPRRFDQRMPTLSFAHERLTSAEVTRRLGEQGICAWHGNYYAWELSHALGCEPEGMTRLGIVHYNTESEVERVLNAIVQL
ncbi:MAG: cysteine desulfurase-like protein [Planctomycetales bacterium]|nr:cysteine desulfurase-like protein [Planctomycetales bacterium]